ncbi:asparaginase domain-containing protein [Demequina sp. NBRC 110053]|uniref:asparaginase domain-containing protein n=1 Tax=Demequina sp. NBRC 110053 TaxID=1570342 RepID=UPI0009FE10A6|nr:asparaginase domain-containing protein [Demequina sp. NBRC 110053]
MGATADVAVLTTGGTIDKEYLLNGELGVGEPAVARILATVVPSVSIRVARVLAKDSRDLTDGDRARLARAIADSVERAIVVTHGTDTMTETASYLQSRVRDGVTVVLTGALRPESVHGSDAHMNLGFALAAAQLAPAGVHVAMGARLFAAGSVRKDAATGAFRSWKA